MDPPTNDRGLSLPSNAFYGQVYTPLTGDEVRTLLLAPERKNGPLVCELEVVRNPTACQYEAVSYVWGDARVRKGLICNGINFQITESLHYALTHLRYPDSWRRLWVDQLCIDQSGEAELMHQMRLMGAIYSTAARVVVWLGREDKKLKAAWDTIKKTSISGSLVRTDFLDSSPASSPTRRSSSRNPPSLRPSTSFSSSSDSLASSISSLSSLSASNSSVSKNRKRDRLLESSLKQALSVFQHNWFCRKWTFQEIALSKAAIICCGHIEVAWSDLAAWYFHYASKLRASSMLYDSVGSFEHILNVRNELDKQQAGIGAGSNLSELLMLTRARQSLKAEDTIYALLGLHAGFSKYLHKITEEEGWMPVPELFLAAFRYCVDVERDFSILSSAGLYKGNRSYPHWPSWLPDWREPMPMRPLPLLSTTAGTGPSYAACLGATAQYQIEELEEPEDDSRFSLTTRGFRVGVTVTKTGSWPNIFLVADAGTQTLLDDRIPSELSRPFTALRPILDKSPVKDQYVREVYDLASRNQEVCEPIRASANIDSGDWLCAMLGAPLLYVLRPLETSGRQSDTLPVFPCRLVGEASVAGLMDGKLLESRHAKSDVMFRLV